MEAGLRCRRGGIRGLLELIRQHREAIQYDLICLGLRLDDLGSERLTWADLWAIVRHSPASSALARSIDPEAALWGQSEHLLAAIFDALRVANWQRGEARRSDYPKPLPRPGVGPEAQQIGSGGLAMDEMAQKLGWTEEAHA